jgi:hypothetical protein
MNNPYSTNRPYATRREPGLVLLFSILSLGIYYWCWIYAASDELNHYDGEPDTSPGLEVLFSILTCHIYSIYWDYKTAKKIARLQAKAGLPVTDNAILFLVLNFIGLGVVPALISQGHMNEIFPRLDEQRQGERYV